MNRTFGLAGGFLTSLGIALLVCSLVLVPGNRVWGDGGGDGDPPTCPDQGTGACSVTCVGTGGSCFTIWHCNSLANCNCHNSSPMLDCSLCNCYMKPNFINCYCS
jgi:hypothetical protein